MAAVADRYLLGEVLSSGGMAQVSLGRLRAVGGFGRTVAIKKLHPQLAADPSFVAMMLDEARLVSRIHHPNVVVPLDVVHEDGDLLLVLEYVHGATLSEIAATAAGPCPLPVGRAIVAAMLSGLHAAHVAKDDDGAPLGVVHRDVSPQNVIIGVDGDVRVLDFGIARARGASHQSEVGEIKGKVAYMAPEQLTAEAVGAAADQYAASVVAWELFTGRRLFEGVEKTQIPFLATTGAVRSPSAVAPTLPDDIVDVVMRGLSREASERFPTAQAMAEALEATGPVATARELAAWVTEVARDVLATKTAKVTRLEQLARAAPAPSTVAPVDVAPAAHRPGAGRRVWPLILFAVVAGTLAFTLQRTMSPRRSAVVDANAGSTAPITTEVAPVASTAASTAAEVVAPSTSDGTATSRGVTKETTDTPRRVRAKPPRTATSATPGLFDRN